MEEVLKQPRKYGEKGIINCQIIPVLITQIQRKAKRK